MNPDLLDYLFYDHPKEVKTVIFIPFYLSFDRRAFSIDCTEPPKYFLRGDAEFNGQDFPLCLALRYFHKEASRRKKKMAQSFC